MASHKLVYVLGIHATEKLLDTNEAGAEREWKKVVNDVDFVTAALFRGGNIAPLSGQTFYFVKAKACKR